MSAIREVAVSAGTAYKAYTKRNLPQLLERYYPQGQKDAKVLEAVASVLPFRVNNYVVENLIDWSNVPDDPMYRLTFPHPDMLDPADISVMREAIDKNANPHQLRALANSIRKKFNPHPAGQMEHNVPKLQDGTKLEGAQHKYSETILFFPAESQYCHSYCTYCFRWAQFVGDEQLQFASSQAENFRSYVRQHQEITDILFTGGDPMVMRNDQWEKHLRPLMSDPTLDHIQTIRIGTKSLAYWPYRYVEESNGGPGLLRLLEEVVKSGKTVSIMAHGSHPTEFSTPVVQEAIRLIRMTGANIRCQAPLIRNVNDDPEIWKTMWNTQVRLGCIPYYMFVERDTGARHYFELPLEKCFDIFSKAYQKVSGICRTVRGPSMSATPGKVCVMGIEEINQEKVFVLKFLQGRNAAWNERVFFAKYDPAARWLDDLKPAFGEDRFFYENPDGSWKL